MMNHRARLRLNMRRTRDSRHEQMRELASLDTISLLEYTLQVARWSDDFTRDDEIEYRFAVRLFRCRIHKAETGELLMDALLYMLDAAKWMSAAKKMYPDLFLPMWANEMLEGKTLPGIAAQVTYDPEIAAAGDMTYAAEKLFEAVVEAVDQVVQQLSVTDRRVTAVAGCTFATSILGIDAQNQPATPVLTYAAQGLGYLTVFLRRSHPGWLFAAHAGVLGFQPRPVA